MPEFMESIAAACGFALISWWLGTGAILWLVRLKASSFRWSLLLASAALVLGLMGAAYSMRSTGAASAYLAFASVILMWSWHELAFLTGWLTGPRRIALEAGARGTRRLLQSVQAVAYHELALLLNFAVLWALQMGEPNHVALCTYALLWCMRVSAKFNLFLGVPQTGAQYLPAHLSYLASYFKRAAVTPFFFLTLTGSALTLVWLIGQVHTGLVTATTGWVLLATLLGLAIVEHVLMAFPLSIEKLWGWAMSRAASRPLADAAVLPTLPVVLPVHAAKADPP